MSSPVPRAVEMATVEKAWKSKNRIPTLSPLSWKSRKDSEIPTFPQLRLFTGCPKNRPELRSCVPWKSGNPRAGFPLFHRTDSLWRKETNLSKVSTMCPARCVYYVPVLTTLVRPSCPRPSIFAGFPHQPRTYRIHFDMISDLLEFR
jgi:hypothetical protein